MKDLPGNAFQCPADEQHLPTGINTRQQSMLVQAVTDGFGSDGELVRSGHLMGDLIANCGLKIEVIRLDPANACAGSSPPTAPLASAPAPALRAIGRPSAWITNMGLAGRERRL